MDYEKLKAHKTVLLDLYTSLCKTLNKEGDEIDPGLKTMRKNIKEEKFLLAIVGEVKAGKSTFINAILGEAMLPFDPLQATSEIVEIHQSEKKEVQVTFANDTEQVVEDDPQTPENEAVPFLEKIASVNEEYRDIPIVQVNRFLIDHYSKKEGKAVFEEKKLENFISGSDLENIYKLDEEGFGAKIREYIEKNISCDEIPQRVTLGYPYDFSEFKGFRLVDTPGINAIGGIENQTKEFINQADAVIYLHRAGQQESKSLRNALDNEIPKRVQGRLILVLTHRSTTDEHERILEQTERLYPEIGSDNIFFVDGLTELHLKAFYEKSMNEIDIIRKKDPQVRRLTNDCFMEADGNEHAFLKLFEEQANFTEIRERIARDAQNSASSQMKDFVSAMKEEYEVLDHRISERIKPLKMKHKDPQSFASDIQKITEEMNRMRSNYNEFTDKLRGEFSPKDRNSRYYQEIHQIVNSFSDEINTKEFDHDHNAETVQSYVDKLYQDFDDKMTNFVDSLKKDFQEEIADRNVEMQSDYSITVPKLPLQRIVQKALDSTMEAINKQLDEVEKSKGFGYYLGNIFFGIPYLLKESEKDKIKGSELPKYWQKIQSELETNCRKGETQLQKEIDAMVNNFCGEYQRKLKGEFQERQRFMEELEEGKETNEKLRDEISSLEEQKKTIKANIKKCVKVGGEL